MVCSSCVVAWRLGEHWWHCQFCESREGDVLGRELFSRRCHAFPGVGEDDFDAAMPAAFASVAALVGWPSCFTLDSPAVFAALSGGLLCCAALSGFSSTVGFWSCTCCCRYFLGWLPWRCPVWARPSVRRLLGLLSVVSRGVCRVAGRARDVGGSCCSEQQVELSVRVGSSLRAITSLSLRARYWMLGARMCLTSWRRLACGVWTSKLMHFVFEHGVFGGASYGGMPTSASACS